MSIQLYDRLLTAAANGDDVEQMQSILQKEKGIIDLNIRDNNGKRRTILHNACQRDEKEGSYLQLVELLLAHGADVNNSKNRFGETPLWYACMMGNIQMTKLLIENNAEIDNTNVDEWTPLFFACCTGDVDVVRLLLQNNAPMIVDQKGKTCLHIASESGHTDLVQLLIDANAVVNIQDDHGYTPLHDACFKGRTDVVRLLLRNGANIRIMATNGYTAEALARDNDKDETVAIIHNFIREMRQKSFVWMKRRRQIQPRSC